MSKKSTAAIAAISAWFCLLFAMPAQAGRNILVDQGNNYSSSGQIWPGDTQYNPAGSNIGTLPFALNIGAGPQIYSFLFDPRGQIVLLDGGGNPTSNVIAPLLAPVPWTGALFYGAGRIDPQLLLPTAPSNPVYDVANALDAFRFSFLFVCPQNGACDGSDTVSFQALLVSLGAGDFELQFNYGFGNFPPPGLTAFYSLGSNTATFAGPYEAVGPDYCFRGGVNVSCTAAVTPVPEPATVTLFVGGIGLLAAARWRRRRSGPAPC